MSTITICEFGTFWGFLKWGYPKMDGLITREHPSKMGDLGVPLFRTPPFWACLDNMSLSQKIYITIHRDFERENFDKPWERLEGSRITGTTDGMLCVGCSWQFKLPFPGFWCSKQHVVVVEVKQFSISLSLVWLSSIILPPCLKVMPFN